MQAPDARAGGRTDADQLCRFIAHAPVAIAMFDRDMRYLAASDRWMEEYGVAGCDIVGRSHYDVFPDQPVRWRDVHRRALGGEICTAEEDCFPRADGRVQWMRWDVRPWVCDNDAIGGVLILVEDITRRKEAEEALRFERDKLASVIEAVGVGLVIARPDGTIELRNSFAKSIAGFGPEHRHEPDWRNLTKNYELYYPDGRPMPPHEWPLGRAFAGEYARDYDAIMRRPDTGLVRNLRFSMSPIRNAAGDVVLIAQAISDITELSEAQTRLRASEDRYRAIFEAAPGAAVVTDDSGCIMAANPAALAIFGYALDELVGSNIGRLMPEADALAHDEYLRQYRETGDVSIIGIGRVMRARRKDGEEFPAELTLTAWTNEAGARLFCGTLADLTERWRTEQALAEAQRLEAVGLLAGGVAHDFNNALAVILGNLELAEVRIDDPVTRDLIERALRSAKVGATVTRRLLSLARSPEGDGQLLSLNEAVRDSLPLLESLAAGPWTLGVKLADDLWPTFADAGELCSALLNLTANARDAMAGGGAIAIATRNVHIAEADDHDARPGDYACVEVTDTGQGMSAEVMARVWEPFYTTKRVGRGSGLGLTTVRNLVEQSRGFARIMSAAGKGTTVSLFLPRAMQAWAGHFTTHVIADPVALPLGDGETILVVDDNDAVRESTMRRLEALGYVVCEARSGKDAIELLGRDEAIDLVFTDVVMPGMSGYQLALWLLAQRPRIRIVLTSAYPGEASAPRSDGWPLLQKPYSREQLARCIHDALTRGDAAAQPQNT